MQYSEIDTENEEGLRLEDYSRRSACDRCRGMKTRCERPNNRAIAQLQQCRRCKQADVKCVTTLDAQGQREGGDAEKFSSNSRKRLREASVEVKNRSRAVLETLASFDTRQQQQQHRPTFGHSLSAAFAHQPSTKPPDGLLTPYEHDDLWFESSELVNMADERTLDFMEEDEATTTATASRAMRNSMPITPEGSHLSCEFYMPIPAPSVAADAQYEQRRPGSQNRDLLGETLARPTPSTGLGHAAPSPVVESSVMNRLIELNTEMIRDLQGPGSHNNGSTPTKSMLVRTLQHSHNFLDILIVMMRSQYSLGGGGSETPAGPNMPALDAQSAHSMSNSSRSSSSKSNGDSDKIDNDLALLLLSCNLNTIRVYEALCLELTTRKAKGPYTEASTLPPPGLESLGNIDVDMRVQVFVHICSLTFVKIHKELEGLQRRRLLTQSADITFQAVLGSGRSSSSNHRASATTFGMDQIVENLQKLVMTKRGVSL